MVVNLKEPEVEDSGDIPEADDFEAIEEYKQSLWQLEMSEFVQYNYCFNEKLLSQL